MRNSNGLTLVELAITLVVLGLIIGLGMPLVGLLVKQNKVSETRTVVKEVKIALRGFTQTQGRLPWADVNGDGMEDSNRTTGTLPYVTLGVRGEDAWTQKLYYDVNGQLAGSSDMGALCNRLAYMATNGSPDYPQTSSGEMAVVFFSPGENRQPDGQDADISGGGNDRVYEDEAKAISANNDDIVGELSLTYMSGLLCRPGYTAQLTNQASSNLYITISDVATCDAVGPGNSKNYMNLAPLTSIRVYGDHGSCSSQTSPLISGDASSLDTNANGVDEILCIPTGCNSN